MRGLRLAVLLGALGAGALLLCLGRVWLDVVSDPGLTITASRDPLTGGDLASGALACAYVGLASVAALVATRGWVRVVVGAVVVAAAAGALVDVLPLAFGDQLTQRAFEHIARCDETGCSSDRLVDPSFSGWPWLAAGGAVVLGLAGALTVVRGRSWKGLGSSYEVPAARPTETATDKGVWDALDRGDDPTA
jgi:uncharacterized membrane protein (TIGR02234 family)